MAGDWIKMRQELYLHPRFISLCSALIYDEERTGLLVYACGAEALGVGAFPPSNESVTSRALRCVTTAALRDVTLCCLLRVWNAVNVHCKVEKKDAVMTPMSLGDVDDIAHVDGFGEAMREVGWVFQREPNSLVFPNFMEYNEPACLRQTAKSNAQRQREYRERLKNQKADTPGCVTKVTKRYDREEKRREEKNKKNTPPPPKGGEAVPVPENLDTEEFRAAWSDWLAFRAERKPKVTPRAAAMAFKKLAEMGPARAVAAIQHSIANSYQGIFEPKANGHANGRPEPPPPDPEAERRRAEEVRRRQREEFERMNANASATPLGEVLQRVRGEAAPGPKGEKA